jgi:DNA-binding NarL/FixJ family response regulator
MNRAAPSLPEPDPSELLWAPGVQAQVAEAVRVWHELAAGAWAVRATAERGRTRHLLITPATPSQPMQPMAVSALEQRVLRLASRGLSQKAIAIELRMAPSTVSHSLHVIRKRLGFAGLPQLVRAYRAKAFLSGDPKADDSGGERDR